MVHILCKIEPAFVERNSPSREIISELKGELLGKHEAKKREEEKEDDIFHTWMLVTRAREHLEKQHK